MTPHAASNDWYPFERAYVTYLRDSKTGYRLAFTTFQDVLHPRGHTAEWYGAIARNDITPVAEALGLQDPMWFAPSDTARALAWVLSGDRYIEHDTFHGQDSSPDGLSEPMLMSIQKRAVWDFAKEAADAEVVVTEQSVPTGKSLASLTGAGVAALAADIASDPMILVYASGALVIVRVADPVLAAVGEALAKKVGRVLRETPGEED